MTDKAVIVLVVCCMLTILCGSILPQELDEIVILYGPYSGEAMGYTVGSPGDYDGDGYPEVFTASLPDPVTFLYPDSNFVRVFEGGNPPSEDAMKTYRFPRWCSVLILDDLNCDGLQEVCFSTKVAGEATRVLNIFMSTAGFYGKDSADIVFTGSSQRAYGHDVFSADADADGENELIIAEGSLINPYQARFYIYEAGCDLDTIPDYVITIDTSITRYTFRSDCIGDINGDGYADYATSSHLSETPSSVLIYYGSTDNDSIPEHRLLSPWENSLFGYDIVPLRDINDDDYDDFIITSTGHSPALYYGGSPFDTVPLLLEYPGRKASRIGDLNDDGWDDIAIGHPDESSGWGGLYVYFGGAEMDTIADIQMHGHDLPSVPNSFGKSVGPAGDFNGDGVDDLAVGSGESFSPYADEGCLYIFSGIADTVSADEQIGDILPESSVFLKHNTPNPFNGSTVIEFELRNVLSSRVVLSVFNVLGQRIRTLIAGVMESGLHKARWDGCDDSGGPAASGMYFYSLQANGEVLTKKMLYVK